MKPVNLDHQNKFHQASSEGIDAVFARMLELIGSPIGFSYAEAFDVSPNTIKTWKHRGQVPLAFLKGFAKKHGGSLDYLLKGTEVDVFGATCADAVEAGCLSVSEKTLIDNYRAAALEGKQAIEAFSAAMAKQASTKKRVK